MLEHMTSLTLPQAKVLSMFSLGMGLAQGCGLAKVAEAVPALGNAATVERRLHRFIRSPRLDWRQAGTELAGWVLRRPSARGVTVLLVDETHQSDRLRAMVVSVAVEGRAVPVAWWCYRPDEWPMGQVELIRTLLVQVRGVLPEGARVLVEADRGIGTSPDLIRMIEGLGWWYLVRVQGQVRIVGEDGERAYKDLVQAPGQSFRGRVRAFKKAGWIDCFAVAMWTERQKEAWLLLTNWPKAEAGWYGVRWYEECAFKDFKGSQTIQRNRLGSLQVPGMAVAEEQGMGSRACEQAVACACAGVCMDGEPWA